MFGNDGIKDVQIMVTLKYISIFWRPPEKPSSNSEINLILTCSANCLLITFSK